LIAEVTRHTYFQLPLCYRTESDYLSYANALSGRPYRLSIFCKN